MFRRNLRIVLAALGLAYGTTAANAGATLNLQYSADGIGGGLYQYAFTLSIDQSTGAFTPGQGWGWIVFGDAAGTESPLTDWVGQSITGGPWTSFAYSGGYHNGPTLLEAWLPSSAASTVSWTGTSTAYLGQGSLLFSSLDYEGGATPANFKVANLGTTAIPEPSSLVLAGLGGLGLMAFRRRAA